MLSHSETELKNIARTSIRIIKDNSEKNISLECATNYTHKRATDPRCLFYVRTLGRPQ